MYLYNFYTHSIKYIERNFMCTPSKPQRSALSSIWYYLLLCAVDIIRMTKLHSYEMGQFVYGGTSALFDPWYSDYQIDKNMK